MGNKQSAVILLSRQHLRPSLQDDWVRKLKQAVEYVKCQGWVLCSSVGTANWEIITACASMEKVPLQIFIPKNFKPANEALIMDYALDNAIVKFTEISAEMELPNDELDWRYRDKLVLEYAENLIPISIRPKGHLFKLLNDGCRAGKRMIDQFGTKYQRLRLPISYMLDENSLSKIIAKSGRDYIIHWTRSSNGPWPNERKIDFFGSVLNSETYPRTAFDTIRKMIEEKRIIASSRKMPGKTPTVSFSGLSPVEAAKLMRWRPRYRQMSFEPYGIGIERELAPSLDIKEVQYYDSRKEKSPTTVPFWLTQSIGKITDWRHECEYRHLGNFDLSCVPVDKLILYCRYRVEAEEIESKSGIKSAYVCD